MYTQKSYNRKYLISRSGVKVITERPINHCYSYQRFPSTANRKGHPRLFNYGNEIHQQLLELLMNFVPSRREHYPNLPFWRLVRDGFWELQLPKESDLSKDNKQPSKNKLIQQNVLGGFDQESYQLLIKKPSLINKLAQQILSEHFLIMFKTLLLTVLIFPTRNSPKTEIPLLEKISYVLTIISVLYVVIIYVMIAPWLAQKSLI